MCVFGWHFWIKVIDAKRWTCNFGIWHTFKEGKSIVDYVGVLKEVIELDFKSLAKEIIFEVCWFKQNVQWNDCVFSSVGTTSNGWLIDNIVGKMFLAPKSMDLN
jgi:hypothetical protein